MTPDPFERQWRRHFRLHYTFALVMIFLILALGTAVVTLIWVGVVFLLGKV